MSAGLGRRSAVGNLVAQGGALAVVSLASVLVARFGGAAVLGEYSLLRVLPWLTGVVVSCGAPVAAAYFLADPTGDRRRVVPTLALVVLTGAVVAAGVWWVLTPVLGRVFFPHVALGLLELAGVTVVTQLVTVWTKACCQGTADIVGANTVIVGEELAFLPAYAAALGCGLTGLTAVVTGMAGGGVLAMSTGLLRMRATGLLGGWGRPSWPVARTVVGYGARAQLGNLLWLVNLRLDFLLLDALAGPAVLGVYAVGTKFAEIMRLPATAMNYVLYPRFARVAREEAVTDAWRIMPRAIGITAAGAPVLALASVVVVPWLFGPSFHASVLPACILLVGLCVEGAAAVSSALLTGIGWPGRNSLAMATGVVVTVVLDLLLIRPFGATGAAVASTAAYLTTTAVLVLLMRGARRTPALAAPIVEGAS